MSVLAIIPARRGSKRLPGKNIKSLAGKPMIAWTIEAAIQAECIDRVIVSTDCEVIAKISKEYGAEVPFLRPVSISGDQATTAEVVQYTLEAINGFNKFSHVVILQPTSPLRKSTHIDEAWELLHKKRARAIVSVTPCEHPPEWSNTLPDDLCMKQFLQKGSNSKSKNYRLNGAIYLFETVLAKLMVDLYELGCYAYIMENRASIDVDHLLDFEFAEFLMKE